MGTDFAQCEDDKACLYEMAECDGIEDCADAADLRSNNLRQYDCLVGPSDIHTLACARWLGCLSAKYKARLVSALKVAGVVGLTSSNSSASSPARPSAVTLSQQGIRGGEDECTNWVTEDPESWACDCYDQAQSLCLGAISGTSVELDVCLRAIVCDREDTCSEWKTAYCQEQDVINAARMLELDWEAWLQMYANIGSSGVKRKSRSLLSVRTEERQEHLDDAVGSKNCV